MTKQIPAWWPTHPPIYDIAKSYLENAEEGPFFSGEIPQRSVPPREQWGEFLGFPVASKIGVPAGPLLNARWVALAAQLGFDIVTYKTIRSKVHAAHPVPNMIYVETEGFLAGEEGEPLRQASRPPTALESLAVTNSFGIPSRDRSYLLEDIARAHASLHPGQVMIVSVVGTPRPGEDFVEDFVLAALLARDAGAQIIEVDYSCPNVVSCEGSLHTDPNLVETISAKVQRAIGAIPLIIKVGAYATREQLRAVMQAAARAGVRAICGINTLSRRVVTADGAPALGPQRLKSGVCGGPIRQEALRFVSLAREIEKQDMLGLSILGTGGVTDPSHFDLFFAAGADVAMSAVGMMWDPYLGARYHDTH